MIQIKKSQVVELLQNHVAGVIQNIGAFVLAHRAQFGTDWAFTVRGDVYYDKTQDVIYQLPNGQAGKYSVAVSGTNVDLRSNLDRVK